MHERVRVGVSRAGAGASAGLAQALQQEWRGRWDMQLLGAGSTAPTCSHLSAGWRLPEAHRGESCAPGPRLCPLTWRKLASLGALDGRLALLLGLAAAASLLAGLLLTWQRRRPWPHLDWEALRQAAREGGRPGRCCWRILAAWHRSN